MKIRKNPFVSTLFNKQTKITVSELIQFFNERKILINCKFQI